MSDNRLARALFQLAICGGSLAVPQDLVPKEKASKNTEQTATEDKPAVSLPSEGIHAGCCDVLLTVFASVINSANDETALFLSQGEAVPQRQPLLSELNLHFGPHGLDGEEVD